MMSSVPIFLQLSQPQIGEGGLSDKLDLTSYDLSSTKADATRKSNGVVILKL